MTEQSSLADAMVGRSGQSPFIQATLTDYDPATKLSTVKILGGEIPNIPKLDHVQFGGEWELIDSGSNTGDSSIPIPNRSYREIAMNVWGYTESQGDYIGLRVNDGSDVHRYSRWEWVGNGNTSNSNSTSDRWAIANWNFTHTNHLIVRLWYTPSPEDIEWQFESWSANSAGGTSNQQMTRATGVLDESSSINIDTLTLLAAIGSIDFIAWDVWGRTAPATSGLQLLCIRDESIPLTIIGVRGGATTQES